MSAGLGQEVSLPWVLVLVVVVVVLLLVVVLVLLAVWQRLRGSLVTPQQNTCQEVASGPSPSKQ